MNRFLFCSLACTGLASVALAQLPNFNSVDRNNKLTLIGPTTVHTPPDFFLAGVQAGTETYRWIPALVNSRASSTQFVNPQAEPRRFMGFTIMLQPVNWQGPVQGGYLPAMAVRRPVYQGSGFVPDYQSLALISFPASTPYTFTFNGPVLLSRTFTSPVTLHEKDVVLTAMWNGGERVNTRCQAITGSHYEVTFVDPSPLSPSATIGYKVPGFPVQQNTATNELSRPYLSYLEDAAVVNARATWATLAPAGGLDYGIASGTSRLSQVAGSVAFDVAAGPSNANLTAVTLFNFGSVYNTPTPMLGITLEVNPNDPNLGLLPPLALDGSGNAVGPTMFFNANPSALGLAMGVEYAIYDANNGVFTTSTQATWVKIH